MKTQWIALLMVVFISACTTTPQTPPDTAQGDAAVQEEISRYVSATDANVEAQVVSYMKENGVTTTRLRELIKKRPLNRSGKTGTFLNLPVKSQGKEYPFSLFVPPLDENKSYPLVVILHGAGGNGKTTLGRWVERLGSDFIIACPSYPMGAWWSVRAETMVLNLIHYLRTLYPIDPSRVLLTGLSNGAVGAYMMGMFYPDYFAGVVPIAGTISERYMHFLINLVNTPLYTIQGEHDPIFLIQFTQRIQKILTAMKYPAVFRIHSQNTLRPWRAFCRTMKLARWWRG